MLLAVLEGAPHEGRGRMTHPDPAIRAQFDRDRARQRAELDTYSTRGTMGSIARAFGKLPDTLKALIALGAAFGCGMFVVRKWDFAASVPALALENDVRLDSIFEVLEIPKRVAANEGEIRTIKSLLTTIQVSVDSANRNTCLTLAELRGAGFRDCIR